MLYTPPIGGAADDPYIDANPALGIEGSAVPAAAIEDPQREIMSVITGAGLAGSDADLTQLKQSIERMIDAQSGNYALDTGVANAYVVALNPAIAAYSDGMTVRAKLVNANTGASTLNAGGGAVALVNDVGGALVAGDLPAGGIVTATYIASANKFYITSLVQSQGDARYAALAGLATQLFSVAAATAAGHAVNLGQFTKSLGNNGYQKLPGGLIIQWGSYDLSAATTTIPLNIAYPTQHFVVIATAVDNIGGSAETVEVGGRTLTNFNATSINSAGVAVASRICWLSIGY